MLLVSTMMSFFTDAGMAQTVWNKYAGNPVLTVGEKGAWDSDAVMDVAVVHDGAKYRMWYTGSDGSVWKIGYAESADGITWTKHPGNPVLDLGPADAWDDFNVYGPSVIYDGAKFKMWYTGVNSTIEIGYTESADGITWTKHPGNPVLKLGTEENSWDGKYAYYPCVLFDGAVYEMWYTGQNSAASTAIGYAESADGITWTKSPANPVINVGDRGTWDDGSLQHPSVVFDGAEYHLWYSGWHKEFPILNLGFNKIGYATSTDGIAWEKYAGNPVLERGKRLLTDWDGRGVFNPTVILDNAQYKMWYTGIGGFGRIGKSSQTGYAFSEVDKK